MVLECEQRAASQVARAWLLWYVAGSVGVAVVQEGCVSVLPRMVLDVGIWFVP